MNNNTYTAECMHGMCEACECENGCACKCHIVEHFWSNPGDYELLDDDDEGAHDFESEQP